MLEYTTVRAPRGKLVHAISLTDPSLTACGDAARGWHVVPGRRIANPRRGWKIVLAYLSCARCRAEIFYPVKETKRAREIRLRAANS